MHSRDAAAGSVAMSRMSVRGGEHDEGGRRWGVENKGGLGNCMTFLTHALVRHHDFTEGAKCMNRESTPLPTTLLSNPMDPHKEAWRAQLQKVCTIPVAWMTP